MTLVDIIVFFFLKRGTILCVITLPGKARDKHSVLASNENLVIETTVIKT